MDIISTIPDLTPVPAPRCLECHREFTRTREWQKFCDKFCSAKWNNRKVQGPVNYRILLKQSGMGKKYYDESLPILKMNSLPYLSHDDRKVRDMARFVDSYIDGTNLWDPNLL